MLTEREGNSELEPLRRSITPTDICMGEDDPLTPFLQGEVIANEGHFIIEPKQVGFPRGWRIKGMWKPGQGKPYCADQIAISASVGNRISIACLDGQSAPSRISQVYQPLIDYLISSGQLQENEGADKIVPALVKTLPSVIGFGTHNYPLDRILQDDENGELALPLMSTNTNNSLIVPWLRLNRSIAAISRLRSGDVWSHERPGITGSIADVDFKEATQIVKYLQIADSPVLVVLNNGTVNPLYINTNSLFDYETVKEMQRLITEGKAVNADEAREILRETGHYRTSYDKKTNSGVGGVPVCNGSGEFASYLSELGTTIQITTNSLAAIIFLSDGMLYHLIGENGLDPRGVEKLVRGIIRQDIGFVEEAESSTFNSRQPSRERLSDDKSAVVVEFVRKDVIDRLLPKLHYPF